MLAHPITNAPIAITTDASDIGLGATLEQYVNNNWQPLAFYSRQLRDAERKYSTYDRELLAIYLAIRHFRYFLEGRTFTVYTYHKPLVDAISKLSDPRTAKQQRHLSFISEFTTDIKHLFGKVNVVADCLSRCPINNISQGIDYTAMAQAQHASQESQAYPTTITNMQLANMTLHPSGLVLLGDISTGTPRPIVPTEFRRNVFETLHNLAHPGQKATLKLISQKFVWHGMRKMVNQWTEQCLQCQRSQIQTHTHTPLQHFKVPAKPSYPYRYSGPLPPSSGFTHLLTIMDRTTRWAEAIHLRDTTTTECAWIARFGVPLDMTSDRVLLFTSAMWSTISSQLGIQLHRTPAYHQCLLDTQSRECVFQNGHRLGG